MSDASPVPAAPVVDIVDDGLSDEEIATRTAAWMSDLSTLPIARPAETAAESLDRSYADGDL